MTTKEVLGTNQASSRNRLEEFPVRSMEVLREIKGSSLHKQVIDRFFKWQFQFVNYKGNGRNWVNPTVSNSDLGPSLLAFESYCRKKHNFVKRNAISIVEGGKARLPSNNSRTPSKNPNKTIYFLFCNSDLH
ncbi:hypothetical protein L2E82_01259 [Cichorium intybus]|uniref:Uncharacterized protein n=1 Tax=Cichorium intybus TaxID=13427 RepID=A0ACB9GZH9_CICIN|nr:hypothetical protein L2E82_01259 [Cichorium intybus]